MERGDVIAGGVAGGRAAAERHGGEEAGSDADGALRSGGVGKDTVGGHALGVLAGADFVGGVDAAGVAEAVEAEDGFAGVEGGVEIFDEVDGEDGGELFGGERVILADAFDFGGEDASIRRDGEAGLFRDFDGGGADEIGIDGGAAREEYSGEGGGLRLIAEEGAVGGESVQNVLADFCFSLGLIP